MKFSLPANLLLMGEYAILEEGGRGLTLACEPRSYVMLTPAPAWEIIGLWGNTREVINPLDDKEAFTSLVFNYVVQNYLDLNKMTPHSIEVDTRAFFDDQDRKKGYGSSAVVALGITAGLFTIAHGKENLATDCFQPAVEAHRFAQNGKGSGYDIATSLYGGLGVFTGGQKPTWKRIQGVNPEGFFLFQGEKPVRTLSAIVAYREWCEGKEGKDWLAQVNQLVENFESNPSEEFLLKTLYLAKDLGSELSTQIGVTAELSEHDSQWKQDALVKALGAGNETFLFHNPTPASVFSPIQMAQEGLRWED